MSALSMVYVMAGGAFGSLCRYLVAVFFTRFNTTSFPFATFTVNITGSLLMGAWIALMAFAMPGKAKDLHLLFAVGALGGFTTFSAFSLDIFMLLQHGFVVQAIIYVLGSVLLSVLALMAGMWLVGLAHG